jgi:hypothetical protein
MSEFDHSRNNIGPNYSLLPDPVGWIDTASLEDEVFAAIVTESAAATAGGDTHHVDGLAEIDEFFAQSDDGLPEREWRQALLWLLGFLRHRLAELLRCPSDE